MDNVTGQFEVLGAAPPTENGKESEVSRFVWSLLIEVPNLVASLVIFVVLVFVLDPSHFGTIGTYIAVASIVGPIFTVGASWRLLQKMVVASNPKQELGLAVATVALGTIFGCFLVVWVLPLVLGQLVERATLFVFLIGQVVAFWLAELAITYAVGLGRLKLGAQLRAVAAGARVFAIVCFAFWSNHTVWQWSVLLASSTTTAAIVIYAVLEATTPGRLRLRPPTFDDVRQGIPYSFGSTTEGFLAASDRPLLQRAGFFAATGTYAAGYRIVTLAFLPLMALLKSNERRIFSAGAISPTAAYMTAVDIARRACVVMAFVSLAVFGGAWVLEKAAEAFRPEYSPVADVVRWLSLLPFIKAIQFSFGNALTAAKCQVERLRWTTVASVLNVVGNMVLIPVWSWQAAATTTLLSEGFLAVALWSVSARQAHEGLKFDPSDLTERVAVVPTVRS